MPVQMSHCATLSSLFKIVIFFHLAEYHGHRARGVGHAFIYAACSPEKYQANTPYETSLNSLLSSIASSSSRTLYNHFSAGDSAEAPADSATHGLYQCRGDLKPRDCSTCIAGLISQMNILCPYANGASVQLDGCFLWYDSTDFVGVLDDGLRYKRCSSAGGGGEFSRRRDGVLADLEIEAGAAGGFGVRASGGVEGYAQCLGDVGSEKCGECVGEAAAEVRRLCGAAAAGEVFLGQCYVRYWESGYYDYDNDSSESTKEDDVGRTVAIVVGLVAGFALLIILLSFCKKTLSK